MQSENNARVLIGMAYIETTILVEYLIIEQFGNMFETYTNSDCCTNCSVVGTKMFLLLPLTRLGPQVFHDSIRRFHAVQYWYKRNVN